MALSILDTTDSSIIRLIVDYPEEAQKLLIEHRFSYVQSELVAVELDSEADIKRVTSHSYKQKSTSTTHILSIRYG